MSGSPQNAPPADVRESSPSESPQPPEIPPSAQIAKLAPETESGAPAVEMTAASAPASAASDAKASPSPKTAAESHESDAPTDHSLMRRWRAGREDAFTEIYLRYAGRLRGFAVANTSEALATRFDPEDIVQSVFRTFFRKAVDGHYDVPDGETIWKLFLVIALNKIRAAGLHHRAAKRDVRKTAGDAGLSDLPSRGGDDAQAESTLRMVIEDLLADLSPTHRSILDLRMQGYEVQEIADRIQRSRRTVERALQQLRERLNDQLPRGSAS